MHHASDRHLKHAVCNIAGEMHGSANGPHAEPADSTVAECCAAMLLQVNRLDKDNDALRAENNRLATLLAEREPLVDGLRDTVDHLQEVNSAQSLAGSAMGASHTPDVEEEACMCVIVVCISHTCCGALTHLSCCGIAAAAEGAGEQHAAHGGGARPVARRGAAARPG